MRTLCLAAVILTVSQCGAAAQAGGRAAGTDESPASSTVTGLVGYWSFDEGRGDVAANVMGANGDLFSSRGIGSAVMGSAAWAEGKSGKAARFESNGPGMAVGYMEALDCDRAVSVAAWVKLEGTQGDGLIWNYERAYRLALVKGSNRVQFMMDLDGKWAGNALLSKTSLEQGRWHHVAGVYDGKERRIYLDGKLDASELVTGTISRGGRIAIGKGFTGLVDELKVWNRAVSESEVQQAMREDQGRVTSLLRPEHALRFHPVKCVAMLGKPEPVEIAVFNSAGSPFRGDVSFSVASASGAILSGERRTLSIPSRGKAQVSLAFQPKEAGRQTLIVRAGGHELFRTTVYVLAPRAKPAVGDLKLNKVVSVDLTRELGPDMFCDDGASRIVDSPLGRYREAGPGVFSRFVVRTTLKKPGLHLLRIKYPDDKPRVCEIAACSPAANDVYNAQTGYFTGLSYPLSPRFQTLDCLLWARNTDQWIRFCTWAQDAPAAAVSVEVLEIEGGLPSSPASSGPGLRQIGLYWEDAYPLAACFGGDGRSCEAFDRVAGNLCDYLDYSGQNVLVHPAVWYNGPIYSSLIEPRGTGKGADGGSRLPPTAWLDILLKRFEERGLKFYAALNVHDLPSLLAAANTDIEKIKAGAPTFNAVTKDNQVARETWHHRPPAFNAIHPRVKGQVLALVDELAARHAGSPAFGGIVFHLTKPQLLQLGGLEVSYDDWTISEFEKDTGTKLPVAANDPERFRQRYDWLMANAKERWLQWRCEKIADYYGEAARVLRSRRPDLQLVLSMWVPSVAIPDVRKRWEQGERLVVQTREEGVDPALLGRIPGVVIQKFMSATDYPWRLALAGLKEEKKLLPIREADFREDQLKDYQTTDRFGVYFHNRYFENGFRRKEIDGNPLKSSWYKEPHFLASAVVPGAGHFMEYYAHAMAVFDPSLITIGGWTVGTVGHETQIERFASVFRLLPQGKWQTIPGLGEQVVGRALAIDGKRYLYLVNRSPAVARVALDPALAPGSLRPLGPSPALASTGKGREATLEPYQLSAWVSE
ncbi:MAG: LamG domain-containing protein [Verrucomicrobiaceae bacterium]|nr:LamG domain-containing protein [Verrucomicrobiaceae bacterium]